MNKRLLLVSAGLLTALVFVGVLLLTQRDQKVEQKTTGRGKLGITIKDSSTQLPDISKGDVAAIEEALARKVSQNTSQPVSHYDAVVRNDSLQTTYNLLDGYKTPSYFFLADIPDAKQTYQVALSGGDGYPIATLYVLCPKKGQLIYPAFSCKDPEF